MDNIKQAVSLPSNPSRQINFGLSLIFVVFIVFGAWAYFAPLAIFAVASGGVSADIEKKSLQHLEGGIIENIYIKDGDVVKKNQLLIKLNDVSIKSQLDILKSQYNDYLGMCARLKAQSENAHNIDYPTELKDQIVIKNQNNIFFTARATQQEEKNIIAKRIEQFRDEIEGLRLLNKNRGKKLDLMYEEMRDREELVRQRFTDKTRVTDLKREIHTLEGDIANTQAEMAKLGEQINELKNQQLLKEQEFQKEVLDKLVDVQAKLFDTKSKLIAIQDTLDRTNITAPIAGTVVGFTKHTVGGVINNGEKILDIVPQSSKLIVVAKVNVADIDKVHTGLDAEVKFTAFNLKKTKVIYGRVVYVSPDAYTEKDGPNAGHSYYEAKIEVNPDGVQKLKEYNFTLVAGMPAEIMIKTGERTMLSYVIKPFTDMFSRSFNEE